MLVGTGITVNGLFAPVLLLTQPMSGITLSNVPPFISGEFLVKELSCHGKVIAPIEKALSNVLAVVRRDISSELASI